MNILHINPGRAFGGGERHVLELVAALAARGHRLHVAAAADGALARRLRDSGISHTLHPVVARQALDVGAMRRLAALLERHRIDILHAHYARDYPVAAGAVRWRRWRGKLAPALFLTRHHYAPLTRSRLYRWWLGVTERLIAVSGYVGGKARASLGWDDARVVVIPNWVDAERFRLPPGVDRQSCRQRFGLPEGAFVVGCLNRLEANKGQATLLSALEAAQGLAPRLHLALAGSADTDYLDKLRRQADAAGLTAQVSFLGFVEDAPGFLAACDAVAIPSLDEAFSLGALEAWAAGAPVAVSDAGGLAELVAHEETGLRVAPLDPGAWADALRRLAGDADLRRRLAEGGRRAVRRYAPERAVAAVEALYRAALTRHQW
ncbi:MAG: hypothetical protein CFK52_11200 [Chloracidobacterium sp. CP2_5A]|nr:MAG: hypothetical protein CFK52_11200 [Chloracidobacterium sp. CP2_5A]